MNATEMKQRVEDILDSMDAAALEERIAPVKCSKNPDHPDCMTVKYASPMPEGNGGGGGESVDPGPVALYGVEPAEG